MTQRALVMVLGDQLVWPHPVVDNSCIVVMAEVLGEVTRYPNHVQRVAMFLSAMRHYAARLEGDGVEVDYRAVSDDGPDSLADALREAIVTHRPSCVRMIEPGRWDLKEELERVCSDQSTSLEWVAHPGFFLAHEDFEEWAEGRKRFLLEDFYRHMRKRFDVLMSDGSPAGDAWNFDKENRRSFGKSGPQGLTQPHRFLPDETTQNVFEDLEHAGLELAGDASKFDWPVTADDARCALQDFIEQRLPQFGDYQDAVWEGEAWLFHSRLSAAINLGLITPHEVVEAAVAAYDAGHAPINAVEGFVRQVLGWREYVRGLYWQGMPDMLDANGLQADRALPQLYWTGETEMRCLADVVTQLLDTGYAHHIQRLMVAGLFAQLLGVQPREVHEWFMAYYVDSVEWVTLPNVVGMSQYADQGKLGSKPYVATGKYIDRQTNYCKSCRFDPSKSTGEDACPFTTLYWDFLARHKERFASHPRMALQVKNLERKDQSEVDEIRAQAKRVVEAAQDGTL